MWRGIAENLLVSTKAKKPVAAVVKPEESPPPRGRRWSRWVLGAVGLIAALAGAAVFADWWLCLPDDAQATFVGRGSCRECHQPEYDLWVGSHHDLAMDRATPETVLGDFNDVAFEQFGIRSRLFRRGDKFFAHTEGPDGKLADFEIKYVLGVTPLQNYMVEFDRAADQPEHEIARLQVLRITWDTPRKRWFYVPPPDVRDQPLAPDDDLHWTGMAQRWNNMCADCHSTDLQKNFDVASRTYHTTYAEIDVSCEACHGPASLHVELARSRRLFWDRKRGYGLARLKDNQKAQIETCAPCHSRRGVVHPNFRPGDDYHDYFVSELLRGETYHADGQIQDEDYEYASFLQSKMYHKGIKCSDCHDPHSMRIRYRGNALCTSCHAHPAGKYDGPSHHHHQPDSIGAACPECHMPRTTYMEVDPRLDHSIRNPRPDVSVDLGTPNACTRCHLYLAQEQAGTRRDGAVATGFVPPAKPYTAAELDAPTLAAIARLSDRPDLLQYQDWVLAARRGDAAVKEVLARLDQWMRQATRDWYGDKPREWEGRRKHFAYVLDAARRGEPQAEEPLIELVGDGRLQAIVRATALLELGQYGSPRSTAAIVQAVRDADPQVRLAAVGDLVGRLAEEPLVDTLGPVLDDPRRAVRYEAARALAGVSPSHLRGAQRDRLQAVLEELQRGALVNNDRAAAHLGLGALYESLGEDARAAEAYRTAIHVEPGVTGPRTNLAAVCERLAEAADQRARRAGQLQDEPARTQAAAEAAAARQQAVALRRAELDLLARDVRLLPDSAGLQYRYGMLLYLHRRFDEAETALRAAHRLEPHNPQLLLGLVLFYKERQQLDKALPLARQLVALRPDDETYQHVLEEIQQAATPPHS